MQPYLPSQKYKGLQHVKPTFSDYKRNGRIQLAGTALQPDGQWDDFLPTPEAQRKNVEPSACVSFGTLNALEILERRLFSEASNWSDRFLAKISGTVPTGNDPHKVAECLRKKGDVKETDWPYHSDLDTWEKYYAEIPDEVKTLAIGQFAKYNYGHQWVSDKDMTEALTRSPLGVSVDAWKERDGLYYRGTRSNHWCVVYGYEYGKHWKVLDTYAPYLKKLEWGYGFEMVKEYTLEKQIVRESLFSYFLRQLRTLLGL